MAEMLLAKRINEWRGNLSLKEAAAVLDIDYSTLRKYASGKRTPGKLARCEIERRMDSANNYKAS